jgi:TatD DNase family protein
MTLIDTHCHLDVAEFDHDRAAVQAAARQAGVMGIIVPAIHATGWSRLLTLCAEAPDLYPALGLHPIYLQQHSLQQITVLEKLIQMQRPIAIGEIGLDYWVLELDRAQQQRLLEAQLSVAVAAQLPVLLHVRKAHDPMLATLRRIRTPGGIAHAFNGSLQHAHHYLDLGFKLGFGGMLTFERSRKLRNLARVLPADALVLETDAPDLTPFSHKGERNSPEYLPECLAALAQVRGEDPMVVAEYTTRNAREVLNLPITAP